MILLGSNLIYFNHSYNEVKKENACKVPPQIPCMKCKTCPYSFRIKVYSVGGPPNLSI